MILKFFLTKKIKKIFFYSPESCTPDVTPLLLRNMILMC